MIAGAVGSPWQGAIALWPLSYLSVPLEGLAGTLTRH
jgi:hypothetical protein